MTPSTVTGSNWTISTAPATSATSTRTTATRMVDMTAVCLEPYHEHSHPLMMTVAEAVAIVDGGSTIVSGTYVVPPAMTGTFATPIGTRLVGNMFETYAQRRFYLDTDSMQAASTDGTGSLAYKLPPAPGSELHHEVIVRRAGLGTQVVARRLPYTTQVGFDVGAQLIQWVTTASFAPATRTLSWTTEAGVFLARDNIGTVDWLALPADVDSFSMSFATF